MRQSDGSEILGPNDPRNLVIGIIHVSPSDDRQSVVNAIATQDKQGRDQIVLDLPVQNRSFKNAIDFTGLHQMSSELEAALVLVAPERSKIASLAHKEGFTVYATLEELASAEFPPLEPDGAPEDYDEAEHTLMFPLELPNTPPATLPNPPAPVLPSSQGEQASATAPLTPPAPEPDEEEEPTSPSLAIPPLPPSVSGRQSPPPGGPVFITPAAGAAGQPAAAHTSGSNLPVVIPGETGIVIPPQLPLYYEPLRPPARRRSWRGLLITAATMIVVIGILVLFNRPILDLFFPPTATVTIVPVSQRLSHVYPLTAVLGLPDPSKNEVDARALYADSQKQTQTVAATGQGQIAGQQAEGTLTFYNGSAVAQTIPAGTVVFDANGIAVVIDQSVKLSPLDTTSGLAGETVLAHTVGVGHAQNIPAYDFNSTPCCSGALFVTNTQPFSGGQDAQQFSYVLQSDIDGAAQNMGVALARQATMTLQSQVRPNERAAGSPRCAPQVSSDHQAGERANAVVVTVIASCVGEVYDFQAAQALAAHKLGQDAALNPGASYAPVGNIAVQITQALPDTHGNVQLPTSAAGVWVYQFSVQQRTALADLIAGRNSDDARQLLLKQKGVQGVTITLTGVGVNTVPSNTGRITIAVAAATT